MKTCNVMSGEEEKAFDNWSKSIGKKIVNGVVAVAGVAIISGFSFYYGTESRLAAHDLELVNLRKELDKKADTRDIEFIKQRLEKVDNSTEQIKQMLIEGSYGRIR